MEEGETSPPSSAIDRVALATRGETNLKPFGSFIAFVVAIAAPAVAVFAFSAPLQAQDETYVDLSIEVVARTEWKFIARNQGTATAYGVEVDIEIADQIIDAEVGGPFERNSGTKCSVDIKVATNNSDCISGVWTVGTLEAGEKREFGIGPKLATLMGFNSTDHLSVPARAVIKNAVPGEENRFKDDNIAVGWIWVNQLGGGNAEAAVGHYWLEARVDDLLPEAGDTVIFTFRPISESEATKFTNNAKVRLKLSNGMSIETTPSPPGTTTFTGMGRTWEWNVGNIAVPALEVPITLANPLPDGVTPSDLCLSANLTAHPDDSTPGDNSAKICFKEDPVTLLQTGETHLFTIYPCVGVSTYPCSTTDTIEIVANGGESARAAGVARDDAIMDPGNVIVQVKDHDGRVVTGSDLSWGSAESGLSTSIDNSRLSSADWTHFQWRIASTQLPTGGNLSIHPNANRSAIFLHTGTKDKHPPTLTPMAAGLKTAFATYIKFDSLGTYIIDFTQENTHSNGTPDTMDDVNYSDSGRYTFHVGPVAELDISDGDGGLAPAGTRAFTIVVANNGPDDAPAVEVRVTGLNASDYVSHSATAGAFDSGTGVWTIGELREPGYQQSIYGRDGETLTIITSAAVDTEITAAISNNQDYEVCIDSEGEDAPLDTEAGCDDVDADWDATAMKCTASHGRVLSYTTQTACDAYEADWHTAKYYDYISENNSATIEAKDGTGADLPSLQSARASAAAIIVNWAPVAEVNGRKATHYEVQRETNPWPEPATTLEPRYVDAGIRAGDTHRYRVRAINDRGQEGPWSAPIEGSVAIPTPEPTPTPEPRRSEPEPSNSSPKFTDGGSTTRHIQENSEPGTDVGSPVSATDVNRDRLTYELGGTDADSFEIVASSGQIRTKAELDYETKTRYRVAVSVSDGKNSRGEANESVDDVIDVTIAVTNQGEQGSITLSEALPVVGTEIGAELTDPDGGLSRVSWAWERSADGDVWSGIPEATSRIYTPVDGDAGHYLRVTASYTDGHGPSKSATAALGVPVTALSVSERYDGDGDGAISIGEALQAASDYRDGIITYDEAIAVANLYFESRSS